MARSNDLESYRLVSAHFFDAREAVRGVTKGSPATTRLELHLALPDHDHGLFGTNMTLRLFLERDHDDEVLSKLRESAHVLAIAELRRMADALASLPPGSLPGLGPDD